MIDFIWKVILQKVKKSLAAVPVLLSMKTSQAVKEGICLYSL